VLHIPYKWLLNKFNGKATYAALVTTGIAVFAILIPAFFIGSLLTQEVVDAYNLLTQSGGGVLVSLTAKLNDLLHRLIPSTTMQINIAAFAETFLQYISANLNNLFLSVANVFFDVILMLIGLFFFLRDGEKLKQFAMEWSPLPRTYDEDIFTRLGAAVAAAVKGTVVVAIAQGVATGIGLAIFGVPGALLWGVVATFMALIPVVGTGFVTVPAVLYLLLTQSYVSGIGLALWSFILVANIDTLLRPLLLRKEMKMHPLITFLSVIGGLSFFGPIGFVAGPIVIALFFVLLDIYPAIVKGTRIEDKLQ
jgi:predicted PurR-regulated permease PerM